MSGFEPVRRWGNDFELQDLLEASPGGLDVATQDFGLLTIAARLTSEFPSQLVFKGGFVLRHALGITRFSKDIDATRIDPPRHKFEAG